MQHRIYNILSALPSSHLVRYNREGRITLYGGGNAGAETPKSKMAKKAKDRNRVKGGGENTSVSTVLGSGWDEMDQAIEARDQQEAKEAERAKILAEVRVEYPDLEDASDEEIEQFVSMMETPYDQMTEEQRAQLTAKEKDMLSSQEAKAAFKKRFKIPASPEERRRILEQKSAKKAGDIQAA